MTELGPIGRLGRFMATHFRGVVIAWVLIAVGAGVFAPPIGHGCAGPTFRRRGLVPSRRLHRGPGAATKERYVARSRGWRRCGPTGRR